LVSTIRKYRNDRKKIAADFCGFNKGRNNLKIFFKAKEIMPLSGGYEW